MKKIILLAAVLSLTAGLFAETAFSGYSGGKLNYATNQENLEIYDPDLSLQAFSRDSLTFLRTCGAVLNFL